MRQFVELKLDDGKFKLGIYCCVLEAGEVDELISMLVGKGFIMTFAEADSLSGEIVIEHYKDVIKIRKELSEQGFSWSPDAKRIKLPESKE
ncbi:hypothetical protein ES705_40984 [subsurface metagenome]